MNEKKVRCDSQTKVLRLFSGSPKVPRSSHTRRASGEIENSQKAPKIQKRIISENLELKYGPNCTKLYVLDEALIELRSLRKQFLKGNHTRTTFDCQLWNWYFPRFPKVLTGNLPFVVQDLCILQRLSKRIPKSAKVPRKVPREPFPRISQYLSELLFSSKKQRIRRKPRPCLNGRRCSNN